MLEVGPGDYNDIANEITGDKFSSLQIKTGWLSGSREGLLLDLLCTSHLQLSSDEPQWRSSAFVPTCGETTEGGMRFLPVRTVWTKCMIPPRLLTHEFPVLPAASLLQVN